LPNRSAVNPKPTDVELQRRFCALTVTEEVVVPTTTRAAWFCTEKEFLMVGPHSKREVVPEGLHFTQALALHATFPPEGNDVSASDPFATA